LLPDNFRLYHNPSLQMGEVLPARIKERERRRIFMIRRAFATPSLASARIREEKPARSQDGFFNGLLAPDPK